MKTVNKVMEFMAKKGYSMFIDKPYDLNIVGIRSEFVLDKFNCQLLIFYVNEEKHLQYHLFPFTTYPGKYWLFNPMTAGGTAVITEGQHRSVWNIGMHHNIVALVQNYQTSPKHKPMSWVRVPQGTVKITRDMILKGRIESGYVGLNCHPVMDGDNTTVGQDSAGCQVAVYRADFDFITSICRKQIAAMNGDLFSYTLIHNQDLG